MAAPSGTVWGSIVNGTSSGRKGRLGIYTSVSNTNTESTVTVQVWFWTIYSCSDTGNTLYYNVGSDITSASTSVGAVSIKHTVATGSGWNTANQSKIYEKTYTYTRGTSAKTYKVYSKISSIDILNGTVYANTSYTVPALTSYTVSYNANGGSGAPGSQTKWYGKSLTLSSTTPTRTGYSFLGWATSSSATSASVQPGATYTSNSSVTYYAVWKANTYTVKYDANGGSGAPGSQTKTYGKTLTLSSTKPTRTNYTFNGWATSKSATTVKYAAGASYTANAAITLYAVWTLAYTKPRITNFSVKRCTSDGTLSNTGKYYLLKFNWACDKTVTSIKLERKVSSSSSWVDISPTTLSASGTSGSISTVRGGSLSTDVTYDIRVTVADGSSDTNKTIKTAIVEGTQFLIDLKSTGDGIAFGKPAELSNYMDVGYNSRFRNNVYIDNNKTLYGKTTDGTDLHMININTNNNTVIGYGGYNAGVGATNLYGNELNLYSKGNINVKSSLHLEKTTDASGTADNNPALTIGSASGAHLEFDGNEIMAKGSATTTAALILNNNGGDVNIGHATTDGTIYIKGCRMAANKVLRSGSSMMRADQSWTLNEAISAQANGIVLVWSYYDENAEDGNKIGDYAWNMTFVPKYLISSHGGTGFSMFLTTATANSVAPKYLYISDTSITGYTNDTIGNGAAAYTTTSGITVSPRHFILRYVIGV